MVGEELPEETSEALAGFTAGSRVAGYLLEEQIGAGATAVVFRALDEGLGGRTVALKILAPALAADADFRQRFIRESRAAALIQNPYIIPIYKADEIDEILFISMRYVAGGDARELVRREGALSAGRAAAIISPVASALDAAHATGLVHRDVKPANMLMDVGPDRPAHVYLSDFGLAKPTKSAEVITKSGVFLGTPSYSAPEQIEGKAVNGRADQYALACGAFELLTGGPPFQRENAVAVLYAHLYASPPSLTAPRPDLPMAADEVFVRALAKVPEDRYASCREFAEALRAALGLEPYNRAVAPASPEPNVPEPTTPKSAASGHRLLTTASCLALVSAALLAAGFAYEHYLFHIYVRFLVDWYQPILATLALVAGVFMLLLRTARLVGPGFLVGIIPAAGSGILFFLARWWYGNAAEPGWWFGFVSFLLLVVAAGLAGIALAQTAEVQVRRLPESQLAWLVIALGGTGALALSFYDKTILARTSLWSYTAPPIWVAVMALAIPAFAAMAVPRPFSIAVLAGWIGSGAASYYQFDHKYNYPGSLPVTVFGLTLLALLAVTVIFARARPTAQTRP